MAEDFEEEEPDWTRTINPDIEFRAEDMGCSQCGEHPTALVPIFIRMTDMGNFIRYKLRVFCVNCAVLKLGIVDMPSKEESEDE